MVWLEVSVEVAVVVLLVVRLLVALVVGVDVGVVLPVCARTPHNSQTVSRVGTCLKSMLFVARPLQRYLALQR